MLISYARTSTVDQVAGLEAQEAAFAATGCTKLFAEQSSSVGQRDQPEAALDYVREGDEPDATRRYLHAVLHRHTMPSHCHERRSRHHP